MAGEPTKPGRPSAFSRSEVVGRAMELFWREGYPGVSASRLAEVMNIQRSSFYNTFGSRETVFLEALELYAQAAPDRVLDRLQPGEPVLPALVGFFHELTRCRIADGEARGCLVCNSVAELGGIDENVGSALRELMQARVEANERILQQAVDQRELSARTDVAATARCLAAFLLGFNLLSKTVRNENELLATADSFLLGLGVPQELLRRENARTAMPEPRSEQEP